MIYREEIKDLFTVPNDYYLAHCISADFGMGAGIVVEFNRRYDMKNVLKTKYPMYLTYYTNNRLNGSVILEGRTFNLITKERVYHKPTYDSLRNSLIQMKKICLEKNIKKLAMPLIGCGIDGLEWDKVSTIVKDVFEDTDLDIWVCIWG